MSDTEEATKKPKLIYHPPSVSTLVAYTAVVVLLIAVIIPLEFQYGTLGLFATFDNSVPHDVSIKDYVFAKLGLINFDMKTKTFGKQEEPKEKLKKHKNKSKERIFTKEELLQYTGDSKKRYLAIIGEVFDVTKGKEHYGKNGGYKFFTGIDGSRAFVTGKFDDEGLIDNIEGLDPQSYLGLADWLEFYRKDYTYVGKVIGYFYGPQGEKREGLEVFKKGVISGHNDKKNEAKEKQKFPECNSRWTPETGSHVWCSTESGGVKRDWAGYPRKYFKPGKQNHRCACVREKLLNNPQLKEYKGCDKRSTICKLE